jgi:hypothetical protein
VGKYLVNHCAFPPSPTDKISDLQDIGRFTISCLRSYLLKKFKSIQILQKKNIFIYTNVWPKFPLDDECKAFVKSAVRPNEELLANIKAALPIDGDFEVVHIRSGDLYAFNAKVGETFERSTHELLTRLAVIETIKRSTDLPIIVMSDSYELKYEVCSMFGLIPTQTVPSHCALEETNSRDTLIDYFILSRAKRIHQFSVHHWGSGFSDTINWVYDIPVTKYKI